jgi:hypothetical protein
MNSKPFIAGFGAVIAIIAAASIYMAATVEHADKTIVTAVSPDGRFKAVRTTLERGGTSPFCFDTIALLPAIYPDDFDEHKNAYEVYAAPCGHFAGGAPSPTVEWLSPSALQITYAALPNAKPPRAKDLDITKSVQVTFVKRE